MTRLAVLCALALCGAAYGGTVRWVTDKPFARSVYQAVKSKYPSMEITCRRPILPKNWGAKIDVPQEDCLIIAASRKAFFCGEFAYDNGPLPPTEIPCTVVATSFLRDVKPGDVLKFTTNRAPEA